MPWVVASVALIAVLASIGFWIVPVVLRKLAMNQPLLAEDSSGKRQTTAEGDSEDIRP